MTLPILGIKTKTGSRPSVGELEKRKTVLRCERVLCVCFVINYSFNTMDEAITFI